MPKKSKKVRGIALTSHKKKEEGQQEILEKVNMQLSGSRDNIISKKKRTFTGTHSSIKTATKKTRLSPNISMEVTDDPISSQFIMPPPNAASTPIATSPQNKAVNLNDDDNINNLLNNLQLTPPNNARLLRTPENVADIPSPYLPEEYFEIFCKDNFMEGYHNPTSLIDVNSLFGYLMYIAYIAYNKTKSLLISINYTIGVYNKTDVSPREGAWGDPNDYEVLFIPVYFPVHFGLVIHEKGGRTVFYDPLPNQNRLYSSRDSHYLTAIKNAIREYDATFPSNDLINVEIANSNCYNLQRDSYNCGYFVSLYLETYLLNEKRMLLAEFDIATERQRISGMLHELCNGIVPQYEARPDNPFHEATEHDDDLPIVEVHENDNCDNDSDVSMISASSTSSRRSTRSTRNTNINYKTSTTTTRKNLKPLHRCKKQHGIYGCFAKSSKHDIEYLDCGKIGDKSCPHCKALLFNDETSSTCCSNGTIKLPQIQPVPQEIHTLLNDAVHGSHFLQYFRIYNMLLRFGSLEAGRKRSPGQGPAVMLINGEIKRNISPLFAADGKTPVHGQLYMLDPLMMRESVAQDPLYTKFGIKQEILERLFKLLQKCHPLCESFQIMHKLYMEKLTEAQQQGMRDVRHVTLVLVNPKKVPERMIDPGLHPRAVNLPQVNEMCAFYVSNEKDEPLYRHGTWLKKKDGAVKLLSLYDRLNDCTHYVLNLANGDYGYHLGIEKVITKKPIRRRKKNSSQSVDEQNNDIACQPDAFYDDEDNESTSKNMVSVREFYKYHLAIRDDPLGSTHFLYPYGNIVQEYILDQSIKADQQKHEFLQKNYDTFCTTATEVRQALENTLRRIDRKKKLGKVLRLSARMVGSPAWYQQHFHDAMALFHRIGRPTFMITSTSNPSWKEVKENMMKKQNVVDRPDVLNRVFWIKINKMREMMEKKHIFGKIKAFVESLEFQKRGGPHTHKLITVDCPSTPEYVDEYVSAEIPHLPNKNDKSDEAEMQRKLHQFVIKFQIHNCNTYCLNDKGKCSKGFPKKFARETIIYEDRPALYKRRSPDDGGTTYRTANGNVITNASVVAYNPAYLLTWAAHSNIEYCYGTQACKYAVKYHFKMGNYAYVQMKEGRNNEVVDYDESKGLMKGYYRSSTEAYTRLHSWRIIRMSHTVYRLNVHLPGEGPLYFRRGYEDKVAAQVFQGETKLSQLEMFMSQCSEELQQGKSDIREVTFPQLPETYWFDNKTNRWIKRKREHKIVGRLYPVQPNQTEKFAIYQLLLCKKGPINWEDLRTPPNRSTPCETFVECAKVMGLLDDVEVWRRTLFEACNVGNPRMMRRLFAQIILLGHVSDPLALWNEFVHFMYDTRNLRETDERERTRRINVALCLLNRLLGHHWKTNADFGIPMPINYEAVCDDEREFFFGENNALDDENELDPTVALRSQNANEDIEDEHINNYVNALPYRRLNEDQKRVVDVIITATETSPINSTSTPPRLFFVNGAGGTGKTFIYKAIIDLFVKYRKYVMVTASTGAAAQLLPLGTTVHNAFRLPLDVKSANDVPPIAWNHVVAQRIRKSQLLIIDEISMLHRNLFKMVDEACRHAAISSLSKFPFGGKVVLIGGDWRQLLPVITHGDLHDQVMASVKNSELFTSFHEITLTRNMRIGENEIEFSDLLERISKDADGTGQFQVPNEMLVNSEDELIKFVYPNEDILYNDDNVADKILLSARRADVRDLNRQILNMLPGEEKEYLSADKSLVDNPILDVHAAIHDVASLNQEIPSGFPPHKLVLKKKAIVILLKNIDVRQGLSNGTRLIITDMGQQLLHCKIALGPYRGKTCVLSVLPFTYEDRRPDGTGLHFQRVQFPVDLAYAITINKAQGQTVNRVGLLLKTPLFSHGQLYVAMSRVKTKDSIRIYTQRSSKDVCKIKNVVAKSIFR